MKMFSFKLIAIVLAAIMTAVVFGSCEKTGNSSAKTTGSGTNSATVTKTTVKTTAKTATSNASYATASNSTAKDANITSETEKSDTEQTDASETTYETQTVVESDEVVYTSSNQLPELKIDLGGRTISYSNWNDAAFIHTIPRDNESGEMKTIRHRMEEAEKKYNFKYERGVDIVSGFQKTMIEYAIAGVKYTDVIEVQTSSYFQQYVNNGVIISLDDYVDYEIPILKANPFLYDATYWRGKHYGMTYRWERSFPGVAYNQAIIDREGLPDPLYLAETKQWTWNEFLDIITKCTKDTNADGIIDQWGVTCSSGQRFVDSMLLSNGANLLSFEKGYAEYALDSSQALRALQFVSDIGFVHRAYKGDGAYKPYLQGYAAIYFDYEAVWQNIKFLKAGVDSGLIPLPMGPDVTDYQNVHTGQFVSVLSTCEYPKEVAQILTEVFLLWDENLNKIPEYEQFTEYGWDWSSAKTDRAIRNEREAILRKSLYPLFKVSFAINSVFNSPVYNYIARPIMVVGTSPYQAVESLRNIVEDLLTTNGFK